MKREFKRKLLTVLAIAALFAIIPGLLLYHYAQPQQVARLLVDFSATQLQMELRFAGEPRYAFWPALSLQLDQASLRVPGQAQAMLDTRQLRIMLPWSSLHSSRLQIDAVELANPNLDLDRVDEWIARSSGSAPLPDAHAQLHVVAGRLRRGTTTLADGITLNGEIGLREIDAWWRTLGLGEDAGHLLPPVRGSASAATITIGAVRVQGLQIDSTTP